MNQYIRAVPSTRGAKYRGARSAVSRCIWLLEVLRARKRARFSDLMAELGISERTLRRDLAALRDAGARIDPRRDAKGWVLDLEFFCVDTDMACVRRAS